MKIWNAGDKLKAVDLNGNFVETLKGVLGDESDGDVVISVDTSLTREMYYRNLTINSGITLSTKGYKIYVGQTLTNNGIIENNGQDASGRIGGIAGIGGSNGGNGADPSTSTSAQSSGAISGLGVQGGNGGNGNNGAGAMAGVLTLLQSECVFTSQGVILDSSVTTNRNVKTFYSLTNATASSTGGGGGGASTYYVSYIAGGGGGGGGIVVILAGSIIGTGRIEAKGGLGTPGSSAVGGAYNSGGGGNGGGGVIVLIYRVLGSTILLDSSGNNGGKKYLLKLV